MAVDPYAVFRYVRIDGIVETNYRDHAADVQKLLTQRGWNTGAGEGVQALRGALRAFLGGVRFDRRTA